jgi:hypothetical protein
MNQIVFTAMTPSHYLRNNFIPWLEKRDCTLRAVARDNYQFFVDGDLQ